MVGPLWIDRWDHGLSKQLRKHGGYEADATGWLRRVIRPGMNVVDVGANIGYHTVLFARAVGESGRVIAFEPDPWNRELLERNVHDNGLAALVSIEAAAVTDYEGTCVLHVDAESWGVHSLSPANLLSTERSRTVEVPATTLDASLARAGCDRIDILKVDAQGAEGRILRGAARTLAGQRGMTVLLELWPFGLENCGSSLEEVIRHLREAGFSASRLKKRKDQTDAEPLPCSWGEVEARARQLTGHTSTDLVLTR
jgi:FkbM family methyltransferase